MFFQDIGSLVAKEVGTIVLDLDIPLTFPFEKILGRTFLKNFGLAVSVKNGSLSLS
jgi:hypothetical protein